MTNEKLEQLEQLLTELSIEQQQSFQVGRFIIQPIYGYYCDEEDKYIVDTECMLDEFESAINDIDAIAAFGEE